MADLEGTEDAQGFASGMAAISTVFLALCSAGERLVAARQLYGGTHELLTGLLPRFGISADLFDVFDLEGIERALPGSKLLYCETIGNPRALLADLPALSSLAADAGIPFVVDNTFASPILCRPVEHGATLVVHSATKFLGGHHDLMGGVVCGETSMLERLGEVGREFGATMAPFNAWLALRGIATLHLRVARSSETALEVARFLESHSDVASVSHPGIPSDPAHALLDKVLGGSAGGTLGFDVSGGRDRAKDFQERLRVISPAASLGGTHSLIVHAASVTHTQLSPEELAAAGISEGFCRLSVGLEDPDDLIADLSQALGS